MRRRGTTSRLRRTRKPPSRRRETRSRAARESAGIRSKPSWVATEADGWEVVLAPAAVRDLRGLSRIDRERIAAAIDRLPAGDARRLRGRTPEWRLRVGVACPLRA